MFPHEKSILKENKMPCDTITLQSVKLKNAIPDILKEALLNSGWDITSTINEKTNLITARKAYDSFIWSKGEGITITGMNKQRQEKALSNITQAYSKQAVSWAAKRAGWQVKPINETTFQVQRG
jgi:hypothetical protein